MKPLFISGHRNPDTDSISGAICYADFKQKKGETNAIACRLGELNAESRFVLERYNLNEPQLLKTVKVQVSDLDMDKAFCIKSSACVCEALEAMDKENVMSMLVTDEKGKLEGVITYGDIAKAELQNGNTIKTYAMMVAKALKGNVVCGGREVKGAVSICAKEDIKNASGVVVAAYESGIEADASASKADLIVLCGAQGISAKGGNIIETELNVFEAARLIGRSVPVGSVMTKEELITFNTDEFVDDIKETMLSTRIRSFPVLDENGVVIGTIERNHLLKANKKRVALVDHNEIGQSIPGVEEAIVAEVVDHHRVANFSTAQPLFMRSEPIGSTCTIIAKMFKESGLTPEKPIAGALLCGILSDTVIFKSPTCTPEDVELANELAKIADEDIDTLGNELFTAGSSIVKEGAAVMVGKDFKEFKMGENRVGIGQITIWDTDLVMPVQDEIVAHMNMLKEQKGYDYVLFMETSIKKEGTLLVCAGEPLKAIEDAFGTKFENGQAYLDGVMSRKKQIVPPVQGALK